MRLSKRDSLILMDEETSNSPAVTLLDVDKDDNKLETKFDQLELEEVCDVE